MSKFEAPILTDDMEIVEIEAISKCLETGVPSANGIAIKRLSANDIGALKEAEQAGDYAFNVSVGGRSGVSRIGMNELIQNGETVEIGRGGLVTIPIVLKELRDTTTGDILSILQTLHDDKKIHKMGGLLIRNAEQHLDKELIEGALEEGLIWIPEDSSIDEEGIVSVGLEDLEYVTSNKLITDPNILEEVWAHGKQGLGKVQDKIFKRRDVLEPRQFLVGVMRVAVGPFMLVIEEALNPEVFHLAARVLHPWRTTSKTEDRQIEIYNKGDVPQNLSNLRVKFRVYLSDDPMAQQIQEELMQKGLNLSSVVSRGVGVVELTDLDSPEVFNSLFSDISPGKSEDKLFGRLLTPERVVEMPWADTARLQESETGYDISNATGVGKPIRYRKIMERLPYVGEAQDAQRMFVSHKFPSGPFLRNLRDNDVPVFLAKGVSTEKNAREAWDEEKTVEESIFFDASTYHRFVELAERRGCKFYLALGEGKEEHLREFYKNMWVRPEAKERFDKVHTTIAMYGSHAQGIEEFLQPQIDKIAEKLKEKFGEGIAFTHGNGQGVMEMADNAARKNGIVSIGIGIDAEKKGQGESNLEPEAVSYFNTEARHERQNIMDAISTVAIFNVGGAGTLEEAAITLTNMKLGENSPAPMIFVDPTGKLGRDADHLWQKFVDVLGNLAEEKQISEDDKDQRILLLKERWLPKMCHLVENYDEAFEVIEGFADDTLGYWKEKGFVSEEMTQQGRNDIALAYENAKKRSEKTKFPIPPYIEEAFKACS